MTNLNIRVLSNGAIFAQYHSGPQGKAYDAAFLTWESFIQWLQAEVGLTEEKDPEVIVV